MSIPRRGEVWLVVPDPVLRKDIQKPRPCLVVSPDELNDHLSTCLVAPMTTGGRVYPFRIPCRFKRKSGFVVLDQMRTVDRHRMVRPLGSLTPGALAAALATLQEMFAA